MNKVTRFKKEGINHKLVKLKRFAPVVNRPYFVGVYELSYEDGVVGYSVMVVKIKEDTRFGSGLYFSLPSTERWGVEGFSYYSLVGADKKFNDLVWSIENKILDLDNNLKQESYEKLHTS
jgi:hypothetical protein